MSANLPHRWQGYHPPIPLVYIQDTWGVIAPKGHPCARPAVVYMYPFTGYREGFAVSGAQCDYGLFARAAYQPCRWRTYCQDNARYLCRGWVYSGLISASSASGGDDVGGRMCAFHPFNGVSYHVYGVLSCHYLSFFAICPALYSQLPSGKAAK